MRSPLQGRTLEQSFSISTAFLVLCLIGTSMVVVVVTGVVEPTGVVVVVSVAGAPLRNAVTRARALGWRRLQRSAQIPPATTPAKDAIWM